MGAGRKTRTFHLPEKAQPQWTLNNSSNGRNLRKSDLGGVIFGCRHSTMKECYSKLLFGLPAPHFSYVKNIHPGLPLFLFNYSDRKLHGIFEAASAGKMNLDPCGWTTDGSDFSPYPAQVRTKVRMQCQPLSEEQFGPIITENYYQSKHFYFELDCVQVEKLISLFSSFPTTASTPFPTNIERRSTLSKASSRPKTRQEGDVIESNAVNGSYANQGNTECGSSWDDPPGLDTGGQMSGMACDDWEVEKDEHESISLDPSSAGCSYSAVLTNMGSSAANSNQSYMNFCDATDSGCGSKLLEVGNGEEVGGESQSMEATYHEEDAQSCQMEALDETQSHNHPYCPDVPGMRTQDSQNSWSALFKDSTTSDKETQNTESSVPELRNVSDSGQSDRGSESSHFDTSFNENIRFLEGLVDDSQTSEEHMGVRLNGEVLNSFVLTTETTTFRHCSQNEGRDYTTGNPELNSSFQKIANTNGGISGLSPHSDNERSSWEAAADEDTNDMVMSNGTHSLETANISEIESSDVQSIVAKLLNEVKELRTSHVEQEQKICTLEHDVVKSRLEIQLLKDRCKTLECRSFKKNGNAEEDEEPDRESIIDPHQNVKKSIFLVGGFDGYSWLSAMDCYHPSFDLMESCSPMSRVRSHASAAKLNGEVYVFGGVHDNLWYNEVESYNPLRNKWTSCPSLNQRKGGLAGVSFNEKIYAIGGGNGAECFSEVEIYHLGVGRWISAQSMLNKRFSPAAAEINGAIYVVGGYDGKNYLNSVERFDPRERSWARLQSMTTKRGCHSVAVLNEKLFAMGGYDGDKFVSTVEVFDPRKGSWLMANSMSNCRGYSPAVVFGDAIYAIGGLKQDAEILDTVECYKEGLGWKVTNLKAVGKRCFFSAIVL